MNLQTSFSQPANKFDIEIQSAQKHLIATLLRNFNDKLFEIIFVETNKENYCASFNTKNDSEPFKIFSAIATFMHSLSNSTSNGNATFISFCAFFVSELDDFNTPRQLQKYLEDVYWDYALENEADVRYFSKFLILGTNVWQMSKNINNYRQKYLESSNINATKAIKDEEKYSQMINELYDIIPNNLGINKYHLISLTKSASNWVDFITSPQITKGKLSGLSTGFIDLNNIISGLKSGELIVVAGRPGTGKTGFAISVAYFLAKKYESDFNFGDILYFSGEMVHSQITKRMLVYETSIKSKKIQFGINLTSDENLLLNQTAKEGFKNRKIFINDSNDGTIQDIENIVRIHSKMNSLSLIIVDYLQLLSSSWKSNYQQNRQQEIATISRHLKRMAMQYNIPILALSQLSRLVEQRGDNKIPKLSDLRDSGAIEQDADIIIFLSKYSANDELNEINSHEDYSNSENLVNVNVAKNRSGPVGSTKIEFVNEAGMFKIDYNE